MEPIITIKNLKVIYNPNAPNEMRALDGINLKIYPEEFVMIHGPSGCGKSTLLYSMAGLEILTSGSINILGRELSGMTEGEKVNHHRTVIGMIFQSFYLIESLKVLENVFVPKMFYPVGKETRRADALNLLDRFGIKEQAEKFPSQLSGGQKQRVAIARSLINNPNIILADEPVGNLDTESAGNVLKILKELNRQDKKTIIMVTHNAEQLHLADRVIFMRDGRIVGEDVIRDKRPEGEKTMEVQPLSANVPNELKALFRSFKGIVGNQLEVLLAPFKAKQLLNYILSDFTEEQIFSAEMFLKNFMLKQINEEDLEKYLDKSSIDGGADWNKMRAHSFMGRVKEISDQAEKIKLNAPDLAGEIVSRHLLNFAEISLNQDVLTDFHSLVRMRISSQIDEKEFQRKLDEPRADGGIGLYRNTARKIAKELEIIMLLKYSPQK